MGGLACWDGFIPKLLDVRSNFDLRAWYLQHNNRSCCESSSLKALFEEFIAVVSCNSVIQELVGGNSNISYFHPYLPGEMIPNLTKHIFQVGWFKPPTREWLSCVNSMQLNGLLTLGPWKECHREDPALLAGISQAQGPELRSKSPRNESSHEVPWRSENRIVTSPKTEVDRSIGSMGYNLSYL